MQGRGSVTLVAACAVGLEPEAVAAADVAAAARRRRADHICRDWEAAARRKTVARPDKAEPDLLCRDMTCVSIQY